MEAGYVGTLPLLRLWFRRHEPAVGALQQRAGQHPDGHWTDGRVFFSGGEEAPPAWVDDEHEAALFESTNFGRDFKRVSYPGEPHEVVETWDVYEGDVICGSGLFDVPDTRDDVEGRIARRDDDGTYHTVGKLSSNVSRIEAL